ncbi:MAG: hypothetical protein EXR14_06435, partial [Pelagibacteraceae bacterium]|nr:hypothetical protein [Pelagibacteraceae bacterium]
MNNIHLHILGSETLSSLLSELDLNFIISIDENIKYNNQNLFVRVVLVEKLSLIRIKKYFSENIPTIFIFNNKDY